MSEDYALMGYEERCLNADYYDGPDFDDDEDEDEDIYGDYFDDYDSHGDYYFHDED